MLTRKLTLWGLVLVFAAACTGAPAVTSPPTSAPLTHIRLPMGYIPSVQYAPFYVAVERGYFAAEGIELEFDYSFETNGVQLVGAGELPFAIVSAEQVLLARAQGLPVVYAFAWFQKFPVAVISPAEAGLTTPAGLAGKRLGTPALEGANYVGLLALLAAAGVPADSVSIQAIGFNQVPALTAGQVDAVVVYSNNEPIRLAAEGQALNTIQVSDYASLAANGLLTNEDTLANNPALVQGFVTALLHGLLDTIAEPPAAYTITKHFVEGLTDDAVEQQVLAATIPLWQSDRLGFSQPEAWETMQTTLLAAGLLSAPQDLSQVYTNRFVP
jgi:NitT/TauT family transport system substrate-binding protein